MNSPNLAEFPGKTNPPAKKKKQKRYPFGSAYFFSVPNKFYDGGYAARLTPAGIARYSTLLRISNYCYGKRMLMMPATEMQLQDGLTPRTARRVYAKMKLLGLIEIRIKDGLPAEILLIHPDDWPNLSGKRPHLERDSSGNPHCVLR